MSYRKTPSPVNTRINPIVKLEFSLSDTKDVDAIRKIVPRISKIAEIVNMNVKYSLFLVFIFCFTIHNLGNCMLRGDVLVHTTYLFFDK